MQLAPDATIDIDHTDDMCSLQPVEGGTMRPSKEPKKRTQQRNPGDQGNVGPGLDTFINACWLPKEDPHHGCQRRVLDVHFSNDHICMY